MMSIVFYLSCNNKIWIMSNYIIVYVYICLPTPDSLDQASLSIGDLLYIAVNSFPSLEDPEFSADLLMWQKDIK